MPIYEYKCKKCNKIIEKIGPFNMPKSVECSCGGKSDRIISKGQSVVYKGSGFTKGLNG